MAPGEDHDGQVGQGVAHHHPVGQAVGLDDLDVAGRRVGGVGVVRGADPQHEGVGEVERVDQAGPVALQRQAGRRGRGERSDRRRRVAPAQLAVRAGHPREARLQGLEGEGGQVRGLLGPRQLPLGRPDLAGGDGRRVLEEVPRGGGAPQGPLGPRQLAVGRRRRLPGPGQGRPRLPQAVPGAGIGGDRADQGRTRRRDRQERHRAPPAGAGSHRPGRHRPGGRGGLGSARAAGGDRHRGITARPRRGSWPTPPRASRRHPARHRPTPR